MKRIIIYVIFLLSVIVADLTAQTISYIIPDIGAPLSNTYVEIIGPHDANNNFGNDGFYLNNPGDNIRIELLNSADKSKIVFGPCIVGWNGRMISSQVFVLPNVNPNSEYWANLRNEFRIPFRVYVNGSYSNVDTFYIVKPYQFGDIRTNPDRIIGEGSLGRRSRRGAMIISSAIFADETYKVSTVDCDPYIDGNQAYLPFVLLSQGSIEGNGSNTKISASAWSYHGGPGGGGGGGSFCDAWMGDPFIMGSNGGDGFTGGGPGGRNQSLGGAADAFKSPGKGTGSNGASLNGIPSSTPTGYESSGGGTGHPFGRSGESCGDGYNCEPNGGYGGGSGYQQNKEGGSAGYRTAGYNTGNSNGGRVYGNSDGIPLAGGSGGASGNPQSPGNCSGRGGGGGGAVRICAPVFSNVSVVVNGENGNSSIYGRGGAGSGGTAEISGKLSMRNCTISATGGNGGRGGRGLIRADAPFSLGMNFQPNGVEVMQMFTSDTSRYVPRIFTLTGSKVRNLDTVLLYIRSESTPWHLDTLFKNLKGIRSWRRKYHFHGKDSIYFICAIADKQYSSSGQYSNVLQYTMSQAAANIIYKYKSPEIVSDSVIKMRMIACPGNYVEDTIYIYNIGDADLSLDFRNAYFSPDNSGFSLVNSKISSSVVPSDSIALIVRFDYRKGQPGIIRDTLFIPHNDLLANRKPQRIFLEMVIDTVSFYIGDNDLNDLQVLDFGKICLPDSAEKEFTIVNKSSFRIKVIESQLNSTSFRQDGDLTPIIEKTGHNIQKIRFVSHKAGDYSALIVVTSDTCDAIKDTLLLKAEVVSAEFAYQKPLDVDIDTLDIGKHCVGKVFSSQFLIRNLGNQDLTLAHDRTIVGADYQITSHTSGEINKAGWDTVHFDFTPLREGRIDALYYISTNECDRYRDTLVIRCIGVSADIAYSGNGNFGTISLSTRKTITTWLSNTGTSDIYVESLKPIAPPFKYVYVNPQPPLLLKPRDSIRIDIEFHPNTSGAYYDTVRTAEIISDTTCLKDKDYPIEGIASNSELILSTKLLDFGVLEFCDIKQDSLKITNPTNVVITLSNPHIVGADASYFEISQQPLKPTIPVGDSVWYFIKFKPRKGLDGIKTAQFVVETDFPKNPSMTVDLKGEQENLSVSMSPASLDFGSVPIGIQHQLKIRLTNTGKIAQNLIDVKFSNPNMSAFPIAAFLPANGGTADVTIFFKPTKAGNADGDIWFIFGINCRDSIKTNVLASGREGQVIVSTRINFVLHPPCSNVSDNSFVVENTGASRVVVDSMKIVGANGNLFVFADAIHLPVALDSAKKLKRVIEFQPGSSSYGIKTAKVITYINIGGKTTVDTTVLSAEKKKFLTIAPQLLDFGNVIVGQTKDLNYTVTNTGNSRITLSNIIAPTNADFVLLPNPSGTSLNPGQTATFRVRFTPTLSSRYNARFGIVASYITDCVDSTYADLTGLGIAPINTTIIIDSLTNIDPRIYNISIPIKALITEPTVEVGDLEFRALIKFNATLFAFKSFKDATVLKDSIYKDTRFIEFEVKGLRLNNDTAVIAEMLGRPMLGNAESTPINWLQFSWKDAAAFGVTDTIPGALSIRTCKAGGTRLLELGFPLSMVIAPNPASDEVNIKVSVLEVGRHSVNIYDVQGRTWKIKEFDVNLNSQKEIEFKYNTGGLSSGFYFIVVKSPTSRIVKPIYIVK